MSRVTLEQAHNIFTKYFEAKFDIKKLWKVFNTMTPSDLQHELKMQLKDFLINLEGQLFRANKIEHLSFFDFENHKILRQLIKFDQFIDQGAVDHFFYMYQTYAKGLKLKIAPEFLRPVSLQTRFTVYQKFLKYAEKEKIFDEQNFGHPEGDEMTENIHNIYTDRQLNAILEGFSRLKGDLASLEQDLLKNGFEGSSFKNPQLKFNLENIKVLGSYRMYVSFMEWYGIQYLSWGSYRRLFCRVHDEWPLPDIQKLLRIGVKKNPSIKDSNDFTKKLITTYVCLYDESGSLLPPEQQIALSKEAKKSHSKTPSRKIKRKRNKKDNNLHSQ